RVMAGGPIVLLMTDGLERDIGVDLEREIDRLHRSCRRLIWLNPLLRFDGFEAKAQGIRTMLPHVDELRSIHSLKSVADLAATLAEAQKAGEKDRILATLRAA
ncbi:MAG TPA: VWA domain-containing protein, partial [Thermohalobaculum sp.]|nr:VWA domain-containing protein [Thermohalobaculum sp.]